MAERHARALNELMELGMALARKLQDRAMAAETAEEERAATLAFHRMSRSVRQTLALEAQLERMLRDEVEQAEVEARQAVTSRKAQVRSAVSRLVWAEHAGDAGDALVADFLAQPVAALIARLSHDLGLAAGAAEAGPDAGATPCAPPDAAAATDPSAAWIAASAGTGGAGGEIEGDWSPPPRADSS